MAAPADPVNAYADRAKKLLVHYFTLAGVKAHTDDRLKKEIEAVVDLILMAAKENK